MDCNDERYYYDIVLDTPEIITIEAVQGIGKLARIHKNLVWSGQELALTINTLRFVHRTGAKSIRPRSRSPDNQSNLIRRYWLRSSSGGNIRGTLHQKLEHIVIENSNIGSNIYKQST